MAFYKIIERQETKAAISDAAVEAMQLIEGRGGNLCNIENIRAVAQEIIDITTPYIDTAHNVDIEYNIDIPTELCTRMLAYASMGAGGKTDHMKSSEIKYALSVFFTDEQIERAVSNLTGNSQ